MGVLDQPSPSQVSIDVRTANQMKQTARQTFNNLVQVYNNGARMFWRNPNVTPQQIAAALGTDGVELFRLHAKIGELLYALKPEVLAETADIIGEFTYNEDGSLNIPSAPPAE
jgi:hypothetical protein